MNFKETLAMEISKREQRIYIKGKLSVQVFYEDILKQLSWYIRREDVPDLIFDFSQATFIDASVVPNLLCVGKIVRDIVGKKPIIYFPTNDYSPMVAGFLWDIGFGAMAKDIFIYEQRGTSITERLPAYFKIHRFDDAKDISDYTDKQVRANLKEIFENINSEQFKKPFSFFKNEFGIHYTYEQAIPEILAELIKNSAKHNEEENSACFALFSKDREDSAYEPKIRLTVSDCGKGLFSALNEQILNKTLYRKCANNEQVEKLISRGRRDPEHRDLYAIIAALIYRKDSRVFGLSHVVDIVREFKAILRVHSDTTRLVITDNLNKALGNCQSFDNYIDKIEDIKKKAFNYRNGLRYRGVHIEIEIPFERG